MTGMSGTTASAETGQSCAARCRLRLLLLLKQLQVQLQLQLTLLLLAQGWMAVAERMDPFVKHVSPVQNAARKFFPVGSSLPAVYHWLDFGQGWACGNCFGNLLSKPASSGMPLYLSRAQHSEAALWASAAAPATPTHAHSLTGTICSVKLDRCSHALLRPLLAMCAAIRTGVWHET